MDDIDIDIDIDTVIAAIERHGGALRTRLSVTVDKADIRNLSL